MPIRCLAAACLFLAASTAMAAEPPAAGTPVESAPGPAVATAPAEAPPAIQVVREGEGVADVWRREGVDFPAYGPDGAPVAPTAEAQALQALASAYDVQFVALKSIHGDQAPGVLGICTSKADCIDDYRVTRRVPVGNIAQYRLASAIGDSWLREPAVAAAPCVPDYRHALAYSADGHSWEVLLDYSCGHYGLRRDGVGVGAGDAAEPTGLAEFDALLASAGGAAKPAGAGD